MTDEDVSPAVVLIAYNRPALTKRVLDVIRSVRPTRFWQIVDGPRNGDSDDNCRCSEVRRILDQGVDWPCQVEQVWSDQNLGCAWRVSSGLDTVFAKESRAIVLEDDCVPHPSFFDFCTDLLEVYSDEDSIGAISGDHFQGQSRSGRASYYFSRYPHCWGWATWRRAWQDYDHAMSGWSESGAKEWLADLVGSRAEYRYWRHAFDSTLNGSIDSWANRWTFACWRHQRVSILPELNLVSNIGFGGGGTHTFGRSSVSALATQPMNFPLQHPSGITIDTEADLRTARLMFSRSYLARPSLKRVLARIRNR